MTAEAHAVVEPQPVPFLREKLAPPFGGEWTRVIAPPPPGYRFRAELDSATGGGRLELEAKPHPPNAPTTIGWSWAGWERRVHVQLATAFTVQVVCNAFDFNRSGLCVPRCFLTLRPVEGGQDLYQSVVLTPPRPGQPPEPQYLTVVVPQSPRLPASVPYLLKVNFNLRGVYSKAQSPHAKLDGTVQLVQRSFAFPTVAEARSLAADGAEAGAAPADDDLDPTELASAFADLDREAERLATE